MNKLCGVILCYNAARYDYCYMQAIQSLLACTDFCVVVAGGTDETLETIWKLQDDRIKLIEITEDEWSAQTGKEKLAYFQNVGIQIADQMGFQYVLLGQADEVYNPRSYKHIREAVEQQKEGYMCHRINLWSSPFYYLQVPENRQPCSTQVVRLAKTNYRSYGDGESIDCHADASFSELIHIWHYGFIRDKKIMKDKVINMQEQIFNIDHDKKLDGIDYFDSTRWFSGDDLAIINEPHPEIMKEWIAQRP